ncbi:hypothetical protein [Roseomonas marmotae]|nr:hypothetical protein [Roseomonas marmotae]
MVVEIDVMEISLFQPAHSPGRSRMGAGEGAQHQKSVLIAGS